jgi:hypothetical protein
VPPGSECAVIQSLPSASLRLAAGGVAPVINDYRWASAGNDASQVLELTLLIHCQKAWRLDCGDKGALATWNIHRNYSASASRMVTEKPATRAEQTLFALSASEITYQPHRIFQLRETLEKFYRDVTSVTQATEEAAASLKICKP